jgi:hypothetical protein
MSIKYKILICCGILAVFLGVYGFGNGEIRPTSKRNPSPAKKERQAVALEKQANNEEMVAAILIMPKSYLPALKRFSQSAMARNIEILRAELEVKDGQMTAVRLDNRLKHRNRKIEQANNKSAHKLPEAISKRPPKQETQMVSSGFLYLLAGFQKHRFVR